MHYDLNLLYSGLRDMQDEEIYLEEELEDDDL